jgi:hypothetical protein
MLVPSSLHHIHCAPLAISSPILAGIVTLDEPLHCLHQPEQTRPPQDDRPKNTPTLLGQPHPTTNLRPKLKRLGFHITKF